MHGASPLDASLQPCAICMTLMATPRAAHALRRRRPSHANLNSRALVSRQSDMHLHGRGATDEIEDTPLKEGNPIARIRRPHHERVELDGDFSAGG
jgi:hypothetical protein